MPTNHTNTSNERRLFTRINFESVAKIFTGEQTVDVIVRDISFKGALVEINTNSDWQPVIGNHCEIVISLNDNSEKIYMHTQVAHVTENKMMGLLCEHIDTNSIGHLRHLLQLNLGDDALLERELKALWLTVEGI